LALADVDGCAYSGHCVLLMTDSKEFWTNTIIGVLTLGATIAVLWLTIVQSVATKRREAAEERLKQEMDERVRKLTDFMSKGHALQQTAPAQAWPPPQMNPTIQQWIDAVKTWISDTDGFLKGCSSQASVAFLDDAGSWRWTMIVAPTISHLAHDSYRILSHRLENLHSILDNQGTYLQPK
jgi:hypothetical protein